MTSGGSRGIQADGGRIRGGDHDVLREDPRCDAPDETARDAPPRNLSGGTRAHFKRSTRSSRAPPPSLPTRGPARRRPAALEASRR